MQLLSHHNLPHHHPHHPPPGRDTHLTLITHTPTFFIPPYTHNRQTYIQHLSARRRRTHRPALATSPRLSVSETLCTSHSPRASVIYHVRYPYRPVLFGLALDITGRRHPTLPLHLLTTLHHLQLAHSTLARLQSTVDHLVHTPWRPTWCPRYATLSSAFSTHVYRTGFLTSILPTGGASCP